MDVEKENYKEKYGDVPTPYFLIKEMLELMPTNLFENSHNKWLDPGCGEGSFGKQVYENLMFNQTQILDINERRTTILKNLFLLEKNEYYEEKIKENIGDDVGESNIIITDYLKWTPNIKFDVIIGNPPYNSGGLKKTPTNKVLKKEDKQAIASL